MIKDKFLPFNLRWLNTVLWAVSVNLRDGSCFKSDQQTWRQKSNGTEKTISQNLLIKILSYLAEFVMVTGLSGVQFGL